MHHALNLPKNDISMKIDILFLHWGRGKKNKKKLECPSSEDKNKI